MLPTLKSSQLVFEVGIANAGIRCVFAAETHGNIRVGNMKQMMKTRGKKSGNNSRTNTRVFMRVIHHQWNDPLRTTPKPD